MNASEMNTNHIAQPLFPVVGIGTAGSEIDTLKKILNKLPSDSGMAFIIIENLALPQTDNLQELLLEDTVLPVHEIVNTVELHPNTIYVIPQNNFLVLENGILKLTLATRSSRITNCLDMFYEAIAQKYESYAVGLLLSWSPLDGTSGLKKLKEYGGATVSAVNKAGFTLTDKTSEFIDYFTTPEETFTKLVEIKSSYLVNHAYEEVEVAVDEESTFNSIVEVIFLKTGTNFHNYKQQTLRRRIAKRMVITKQETAERYLSLLKKYVREQDLLFNDFLISVTYFFREPQFFESLSNTVFPSLVENISGKEIRIWSAGCATGEEVYSLAICLDEYLQKNNNTDISIKIFASDLSEKCIDKARTGIYALQDLKNVSEQRLAAYFTKRDNGYYINKVIRDSCVFAVHDLTKDFPFSRIDLILCRNVLIYFNAELQNQILSAFHYALRDKGFLFLGKVESASNVQNLFSAVEKQEKIYIRTETDSRYMRSILLDNTNFVENPAENISSTAEKDYRKIASDILLEQYSPAAVIITEDYEIVHFHGDTSPFLQPPAGKPTFNIINMVHHELRSALKNAIIKVRNDKKNFDGQDITVKNQSFLTSFEVVYVPSHSELLMVIFCRKPIPSVLNEKIESAPKGKSTEKELSLLKGDFKLLNEEQQINFEELRTTNEELLRRTEELQYLNEQLQTSAEELLSNNEELSCTNDELRNHRNELSSMRNFYESIVKTIKEPLLIIDHNFIVHSANPSFYRYFRINEEETTGFSVFDLGDSQWNTSEFKESVLKKISRSEAVENIKLQFNIKGIKKTMLVNAGVIEDSMSAGMILIALEDITELEETNEILKDKNDELQNRTRQLESFTEVASDNLLEPIRKIYMFGKKVLDNEVDLSESGRHNLNRLLSASVNMNQLIEDLISFSKINFAEKKFKKTDLNIILKKAINDLKVFINDRNAVIEADPLPPMNIIPWQMHLLFTHLISNAVKYASHDRTPQIKIGIDFPAGEEFNSLNIDPDTDYIKLSVRDNGRGFNKDFETLIFKPFYKLESNDKNYGTGLGLTLVQKIVWNHKGFIKASSAPGEGTAIDIYLPLENSLIEMYNAN